MSRRDERTDQELIDDMHGACHKIRQYLDGIEWEGFVDDEKTQDAVIRQIAVIGEAAGGLSKEFTKGHPEQPWRRMADMRNILVHEYTTVSIATVWRTAIAVIPGLESSLHNIGRIQGLPPAPGGEPRRDGEKEQDRGR